MEKSQNRNRCKRDKEKKITIELIRVFLLIFSSFEKSPERLRKVLKIKEKLGKKITEKFIKVVQKS